MRSVLLFVSLAMVCHGLSGQILRVNKGSLAIDTSRSFAGVIDATFAINNRSSTAEQENLYLGVNNNVDLAYLSTRSATLWISNLNYFKIGNGPLIYNGTIHIREILKRMAKWTPEFYGQIQFDESRNMEMRRLLGGGYRWNIFQKKNSMFAGLGLFQEYERWQAPEQQDIEKNLWKINSYLSADINITSAVSVNAIIYYQAGRDEAINAIRNRVSGQIEFKNSVTESIKVKMTSNMLLDDRPIIPLNSFIYEVYFGIEYSFD